MTRDPNRNVIRGLVLTRSDVMLLDTLRRFYRNRGDDRTVRVVERVMSRVFADILDRTIKVNPQSIYSQYGGSGGGGTYQGSAS